VDEELLEIDRHELGAVEEEGNFQVSTLISITLLTGLQSRSRKRCR